MKAIGFDIQLMFKLRTEGKNYSELARMFKRDHTTIIYHCNRHGIIPNVPVPTRVTQKRFLIEEQENQPPRVVPKYAYIMDEKVNPGKSYKEYLAEALTRPIEKRYHEIYHTPFEITQLATGDREEGSLTYALGFDLVKGERTQLVRHRDQGSEERTSSEVSTTPASGKRIKISD